MTNPSISVQSLSDLVVAIDFGTTFSGVAYSHTLSGGSAPTDERDVNRIAENINVIKTWPIPNQQYLEKTPTVLSYHTNPPTWGGKVKANTKPRVEHFKLGLEPAAKLHYRLGNASNIDAPSFGFHPDLPEKRPVDFAADFLTGIHTFVHQEFLPRHYGEQFLQNQKMTYILTVPAIWSDSAKALTRIAATRAGIPDEKLLLITEPEAAALYCATNCEEADLNDGDRFLVCDAGGGTVVCATLRHILLM